MAPRRLDLLAFSAQRHTLLAAGTLDRYRQDPHRLLGADTGLSYALFSSETLENIFRIRWLQWAFMLLLLPAMSLQVSAMWNSLSAQIQSFKYYRFTNLERRDGGVPDSPGIAGFGLMRMGEKQAGGASISHQGLLHPCVARDTEIDGVWTEGASLTRRLARPRSDPYQMWFIRTSAEGGTEPGDAVRFRLEGSDDMLSWREVGCSTFVHFYASVVCSKGRVATPLARGDVMVLDASVPWYHSLYLSLTLAFFACFVYTVLLALRQKRVKRSILFNLCFQAASRALYGFVKLDQSLRWGREEDRPYAVQALATATIFALAAAWMSLLEELYDAMLVIVGVVLLADMAYLHRELLGEPLSPSNVQGGPLALAVGWMSVGVTTA
eukprot:CAMPEP_0174947502 /NCGR_PEP_ID=MMETSP1355-20121228/86741_1 /TAXON_ID=464990 /ORGANISM="Hemiselmis tepida, Strain CCMP443" /LENGTH=381 /DNA_ID=CAMNT_0016194977 /DNA_START=163 /DNA_END=1305 /DNA_ORIENTATION=+